MWVSINRDLWNPVAPASALAVSVLETISHTGDPVGWTFLGRIEKDVAERLGPLITQGLIRLSAAHVHWDTYTTRFNSSWLIDVAVLIRPDIKEAALLQVQEAMAAIAHLNLLISVEHLQ